jgi:hypothetical protein
MVLIHLVAELCADSSQKMDFPSHGLNLTLGRRAADWGIPELVSDRGPPHPCQIPGCGFA